MNGPTPPQKPARSRTRAQETASCGGCSARWSGTAVCHCATCHETFTGIAAFDRHRKVGRCLDPVSVGLVCNERGRWANEPMSEQDKRRRFGGKGH